LQHPPRRPLQLGFFVSAMAGGMRDGALRWSDLSAMAQRAEEIGFDSFWIPDHLLFRSEGQPTHGPWEGWSLIAALAAVTTRIQIGTLVVCTGFRNPALLAKMADTVDEISGGRLILGLGAGWHEPEYSAFGYPFDHRVSRFEEALMIITGLLRDGHVDVEGTYSQVHDCELRPRGPRPQGPPILIGALASGPRMLRLAATYADLWNGWLMPVRSHPDQIPSLRDAVNAACTSAGRDPATLARTVGVLVEQRPPAERPPISPTSPDPLTGSPAEVATSLRRFAAEGISHVQLIPTLHGLAGVEAFAPVLENLEEHEPR
jgi:alkanesulfonate monooxygenase SsuD/methylene tetrahydromethanopterin reductase-like flavin-dependent oxidoreductase (luciferase family)